MTTHNNIPAFWLAVCAVLFVTLAPGKGAQAGDARARADYMIHCQGCHLPDGSGFVGRVPDMRTTLPLFLSVEGGREFLIQVPGSSQSALSDARLADVLNWLILTKTNLDGDTSFTPYTPEEVSAVRDIRLEDVFATRKTLIGRLEGQDGGTTE